MAKKSSFFGKIMGGNVTEEAVPVTVSQAEDEDLEAEELIVEEVEEIEGETSEEETPETRVPASSPKPKEGEDWLSDYEGQLNIDMYQTKDNVIINRLASL